MGLCDFHCHLLPEIDDGYVSVEGFDTMLRLYKESGIDSIAFTPHIYNPFVKTNISRLRETYAWASEHAKEMGLSTFLGSELFVGDQEVLKCVPIAGKYALMEFGLSLPPYNLIPRVEQLASEGLVPILAHIERFRWLTPDSPLMERLRSIGSLVQVNVESVEDGSALPYLKEGLVDLIATDNHGDQTLPGRLLAVLGDWPEIYTKMNEMIL
ncbi:MAG: CpsB/CapC family capsule biosynthesis tyrosine phosphatase [Sphaerochaeta sp.]